jgi:DNA-binding MarR family transcriptional regulator
VAEPRSRDIAASLHSAAIRLLRMVRREDPASGLTGPRLSALSVGVFGGATSLAGLADAEQVSAPTMTRVVEALVQAGLVTREAEPANRRMVRIAATAEGVRVLEEGRQRRVRALTARLDKLPESERRALARAVDILERVLG